MKSKHLSPFPHWKKVLSVAVLTPILLFMFIFLLTLLGLFGHVPGTKEISNIHQANATVLISSDGVEIGSFQNQNVSNISLNEVDTKFLNALLAIEDIRFRSHNGIDYKALGRVFIKTILLGENAGGGSTITQQLAKNLYPREEYGRFSLFTDKLREMIIARRIESVYSKDEILELYLNHVSFGEDTFGIEMASYRFFSKSSSDLSLNEAATLAGVLKATTYYNPHRNPERAKARRDLVIRQMEKYSLIDEETASETITEPLATRYNRSAGLQNLAPYFKVQVRKELSTILDTLNIKGDLNVESPDQGLIVHTTLNSRIQNAAEEAVKAQMKELQQIFDREVDRNPIFGEDDPEIIRVWEQSAQFRELKAEGLSEQEIQVILHEPAPSLLFSWEGYRQVELSPYNEIRYYLSFLNAGFFAIDPVTGHVKSWVGGIDYRHFPYDQVLASRQPGSAFKPILYASAIESGRTPCDYQRNILAQYASYDDWTPRNNNEEYGGRYSLQAALAQSVNTVAVQLAAETGMEQIGETARQMGIRTSLPDGLSVALGTAQMSLMELTTAYTSFLNEGKPVEPIFITKIYTDEGELIYEGGEKENESNQIHLPVSGSLKIETPFSSQPPDGISDATAATMVAMLEKTVNEGTGNPLRTRFQINHALGGKTGTTQNFTDGWFIGFTPDLVFGTRVGGWNHRVRFREYPAYASQTALPIAGLFLQKLSQDNALSSPPEKFYSHQIDSPFSMECRDTRNDRITDRIRDFFTGKSSDEPRVVDHEDEKKNRGNIFKRIGRGLGIVNDDDDEKH
ncbi:transglycosylase domain-containing protein [Rhodohalobacter halophilus]|uniref:transglycosylase domain-containing protein n=1 Tax=Rhodohalobacter halophilus TaxID=1812810 RepID=UPI000A04F50F|nr:transglycosylase domain-containing protein [Rhodohalobacter halophilus]